MTRKKIGVIGVGAIAEAIHIPGILACPNLELAALCDTDPLRLSHIGKKYRIDPSLWYPDTASLLADAQIDAVDICTPNDAHAAPSLLAIAAGKPYCVEKPVALSSAQAEEMASNTRAAGLASMVCFSYRMKAAARYARSIIQDGELGELYHIHMHYFQAWALPVYDTPLYWRFEKDRSGSGALGDLGSHALDLVRFVTGREYRRVCSHNGTFIRERRKMDGAGLGNVDVDDYSHILAEMDEGLPAVIQSTRYAFGRGNYQRMEVYGSKGALIYELDVEPGLDQLSHSSGDAMRRGNNFARLTIPFEHRADQSQSFADILFGKRDGLTATIEDGLKNQRALDAVIASAQSGQWTDL